MPQLVLVRGWIRATGRNVAAFREIANGFEARHVEYQLSESDFHLYQRGWQFQPESINGTAFAFYGGHIGLGGSDLVAMQLKAMAARDDEAEGFFAFSYDDDAWSFTLHIRDGQVIRAAPIPEL